MCTNTRVCLFDVILIVMKWILVQVLGIKFCKITSLYDLSLVLDRTLAQQKAQQKSKSKSEVAQ